jgi:hypothetical protein
MVSAESPVLRLKNCLTHMLSDRLFYHASASAAIAPEAKILTNFLTGGFPGTKHFSHLIGRLPDKSASASCPSDFLTKAPLFPIRRIS